MDVNVLVSCMNQQDYSIIEKSNLCNVGVVVVNQNTSDESIMTIDKRHLWINSKTRGLSVSRNMAIKNSKADICLISDDDEIFVDNVEQVIKDAYESHPDADVIIFKISNFPEKYNNKEKVLNVFDTLKVSSQQISFRKSSVSDIAFDTNIGAGTPNGAGEESKFLLECKKRGRKIIYVPAVIGEVVEDSSSTWFTGYDEKFFYNRGRTLRYIYGFFFSLAYGCYDIVSKRKMYREQIKLNTALKLVLKGIFANDIGGK